MAYEKKIFYVTQEQYDILKNGGTVGSYTGIDSDASYFVRPIPDNYELFWDNDENQIQLLKNGAGSGDPLTIQYASFAANAGLLGDYSASDFVNISEDQTIDGYKRFNSLGVDTINGKTHGNAILRQNTGPGAEVLIGSNLRELRLTGSSVRPMYTTSNPTTNAGKELALREDIPTITGAASTITTANLTASRALVSNASGKVAASSVTSTELGFLSGVTSTIQTQLNGKAPLYRPIFFDYIQTPQIILDNPIQNFNTFTDYKIHDSTQTNLFAGKWRKLKVSWNGVESPTMAQQLTDLNYEQSTGLAVGKDGDADHVIDIDVVANGLNGAWGVTYTRGKIVFNFYTATYFPTAWSCRWRNKDGVWHTIALTKNGAQLVGDVPTSNYLTNIELTLSTGTGAPYITGTTKWALVEVEYFNNRMTVNQGALVTSVGGYIGGNLDVDGLLKASGQEVYHPGNKPTPEAIGAAPTSHNHDDRYFTETEVTNLLAAKTNLKSNTDKRNIDTIPNDYNGMLDIKGLKTNTAIGITDGGYYSGVLGMRSWADSSGGPAHELAFDANGNINYRYGSTTTWGAWTRLQTTANLVTELNATTISDTQYPSSKLFDETIQGLIVGQVTVVDGGTI